METVLTVPTKNEIRIDLRSAHQSSKLTRVKKRSTLSSNGNHPSEAFISSKTKTDVQSHDEEYEGWRYIEKIDNNGQVKYERIPLTAYELLHPQEDYTIVHTSPHDFNTAYIGTSTKINLSDTPQVKVLGDVRTDLNLPEIEPISPDVSVIFGVSPERIWSTFNCQEEGIYPSVVFEVTSPGTRTNDFREKYDYYCQAGIPYYVILDIKYDWNGPIGTADYHLYVFERIGGQYEEIQANSDGRYWLPPLNMWVGTGDQGILCYDEAGKLLMTPEELNRTLAETETQRDAAMERADEQERIARQAATRAAEQERLAQRERGLAQLEAARATEQEQLAQQEAARAAEQERIAERERKLAQQEAARAAEQERIAQRERKLAQQEAARAAEQERIAQQEVARAAEQERIAQQEVARAAEQERLAQDALQAQLAAEAKIAELLAQMAELQAKS